MAQEKTSGQKRPRRRGRFTTRYVRIFLWAAAGLVLIAVIVWGFFYFSLWAPGEIGRNHVAYAELTVGRDAPIVLDESQLRIEELRSALLSFSREVGFGLEVMAIRDAGTVSEQDVKTWVDKVAEGTVFFVSVPGGPPSVVRSTAARPEDLNELKTMLNRYFVRPGTRIIEVGFSTPRAAPFYTLAVVDQRGIVIWEPNLYFNTTSVKGEVGKTSVKDSFKNRLGITVLEWVIELQISSPDGIHIPDKATKDNPTPHTSVRFLKQAPFFSGSSISREFDFTWRTRTPFGSRLVEGVESQTAVEGAGGIKVAFKADLDKFLIQAEGLVGVPPTQKYTLKLLANGETVE